MARYRSSLMSAFKKWGKARSLEIQMIQLMKMTGADEEAIKQYKASSLRKVQPDEFKKEMQKYLEDNS